MESAATGREGLKLAAEIRPEVVLVDLRMPGMNGMEVLERVKAMDPGIATIVITAYGTPKSAAAAQERGARSYLHKPFTPEQIADAVGRAMPEDAADPGTDSPVRDDREGAIIKQILSQASTDKAFGRTLLYEGRQELAGWGLSREAIDAIVSGNRAWIWKRCGTLSATERRWLESRPW